MLVVGVGWGLWGLLFGCEWGLLLLLLEICQLCVKKYLHNYKIHIHSIYHLLCSLYQQLLIHCFGPQACRGFDFNLVLTITPILCSGMVPSPVTQTASLAALSNLQFIHLFHSLFYREVFN